MANTSDSNTKTTAAPAKTGTANPATTTAPVATDAPAKPAKPVIVATGKYGVDGNRIDMATVKNGNKLTNKMAGGDPAPGVVKNAIITYSIDGAPQKEITVNEGEKVVLA